jgi:hypothetical protein
MGLAGRLYKFDAFVYYYGIKFILNSHNWDKIKIATVYSAGPISSLVLGIISMYFYSSSKNSNSLIKVFMLWGFIIGTSMFVAQGVVAALGAYNYHGYFYHNFAVVFSWWHLKPTTIYLINIPLFLMLTYFSINSLRPFLLFSYSYSKINRVSKRRKYFIETAIVPFLMGALITSLITTSLKVPATINMPVHGINLGVIAISLGISWYALTYIEILKDEIIRFKAFQDLNLTYIFLFAVVWMVIFVTIRGVYIS